MTYKAKLLFDECIGWPIVEQLTNLLGSASNDVLLGHAVKLGFGGINDEDWIPQIAAQGWVIITGDRGARPKPGSGEKFHTVCKRYGVTHVALSRSINKRNSFSKVRAILAVWDGLVALSAAPGGSRYSIRPSSAGHPTLVFLEGPRP